MVRLFFIAALTWFALAAIGRAEGPRGGESPTADSLDSVPLASIREAGLDPEQIIPLLEQPLYEFTEPQIDLYLRYLHASEPDLRSRIVKLARQNIGQPYELYLLGEMPFETYDPQPLYCLGKSDCVVFCEHTYAMALTRDWPSFMAMLQRIRYRDGRIGVATRNHFTEADWNVSNRWLVHDVTAEIAGDSAVRFQQQIDRAKFLKSRYGLKMDVPVETHDDVYLPYAELDRIRDQVQDGDFVNVVRGIVKQGDAPGGSAFVGHVGLIAMAPDGTVNFIHSSDPAVREESFADYIARSNAERAERMKDGKPVLLGFKFLRLETDPLAKLQEIDGADAPRITLPNGGLVQQVAAVVEAQPAKPSAIERFARYVEPELVGKPERLQQYVDFYKREFGNDSRLFCFEVVATAEGDRRARLTGFVEFSEMRAGLTDCLGLLGFAVVDELKSLPAADLGERTLGIVKTTHSLSYDRPSGERSVVTDCLLGERLYLLREDQGHLLVHSQEGYLGYVFADDVLRADEPTVVRYLAGPGVRLKTEHRTEAGLVIPVGARLKWVQTEAEVVTAELPTGELVALPEASCQVRSTPTEEVDRIIAVAQAQLGTSYLWGGKTASGIDCSGLVQVAYSTVGINLPRDSNQQFLLGALTATRWSQGGMQRGDALYFLGEGGKIRHTAIYLGDDRYLQAETPAVNIRSLNPDDEDYDPKRAASFAFGKRLLD